MSTVLSGVASGLPLGVLGSVYALLRYEALAAMFQEGDADMAALGDGPMRLMLLAMFGLGSLLFGAVAGLVYGRIGSPQSYLGLALGLAVLMSVWAVVSRTPMMGDKIVMNFVVALVLGLLIPRLAGA